MSIIIGLSEELDEAARHLEQCWEGNANGERWPRYPRAVNLLRAKAASLRKPKAESGKRKSRTVKAWVGRKKSKGNEIRIKVDRLEP